MNGTGNRLQKNRIFQDGSGSFPFTTTIAVLENRHFTFTSTKQTAYIFLVGDQYHQTDSYGKYAVEFIIHIKDNQDKNGKSYTGQDGTKGHKTGQV